jgi:arsenate reductase-like glutaredoxin family protein
MKKSLLAFVVFMIFGSAFAQPPLKKENPPTQKEMEEMMKEAQKQINNLNPEAKRAMDSLGIKMPSFKNVPKISNKQLEAAYQNENRVVPVKDNVRIASISKTPLTNTSLPAYLQSVHEQIIKKLNPSINETGEKIYQTLKDKYQTAVGFLENQELHCM